MLDDPDLEQVANDAIASGLFTIDLDAVRVNASISSKYQRLPVTLLDVPYVNGPIAIEIYDFDIPEPTVFPVRRNFTEANRLLMPKEQVMRYFHQRFVADDIFTSELLIRMVQDYRAPRLREMDEHVAAVFVPALIHHGWVPDAAGATRVGNGADVGHGRNEERDSHPPTRTEHTRPRFSDPSLTFRVEGVDRKSHTRTLYTREEQREGLRRALDTPALVLSILAYQSVLRRYLGVLRHTFEAVASESALADFDKYSEQWGTPNFTNELMPALAIFMRLRARPVDTGQRSPVVDAELFRDAMNFIIDNGAFRNWIPISAEVAADHDERVIHFLCPAVGTVRGQLLDGALLASVYQVVAEKARTDDRNVSSLLETIGADAEQKLSESMTVLTEDDLIRRVSMSISYGGRGYTFRLDDPSLLEFARGDPRRNDMTLTPAIGTWFFDALREAIDLVLARRSAVFFQFNGRGYRLTPGRFADFLRQRGR